MLWHPVQPALVKILATVENTTLDVTVTVLVVEALGGIALLTVMVTLQVPALVTVRATVVDVLGPGDRKLHPAVPVPDNKLHVKFKGASPVALPVNVIVFVATLLMSVVVPLARLLPIVNPIDDAGKVKFRLPGLWPAAAAMVIVVVPTPVVETLEAKTRNEHVVLMAEDGTVTVELADVGLLIVPQGPVVNPLGK